MDLTQLKHKKLELEARLSQSIFEIIDDAGEVPESVSVTIARNQTVAGEVSVSAVYVDVGFGL
ncbi:MAG: hypothetical protein CMI01_00325 [Oceanospirillaceae bacterium]|nr:hypothetical protein [Oceanospirillaceae bacterium]MBS97112.1 hypothetical protein [Oceanospirillaceae bacterium]|tara:strand:+ start:731 stop:919 length:189 start_codon:yes stop_codon:yes gene_type:complete